MTEPLQQLHDLEHYLGRELNDETGDAIIDYLNDDPANTSPIHLAALFELARPA